MSILSLLAGLFCALFILSSIILLGAFIRMRQLQKQKVKIPFKSLSREPDGVENFVEMEDGTLIRTLHKGSGRAVVLLHDLGSSVVSMNQLWHLLAGYGFRVIAFDFRGHGKSTLGNEGLGIKQMTLDLERVLEHYKLEDAILVGHSWGAYISFKYLLSPELMAETRVKGIVSVAGFAGNLWASVIKQPVLKKLIQWKYFQQLLRKRIYGWAFAHSFFGEDVDPAFLEGFLNIYRDKPIKRLFPLIEEQIKEDLYEKLQTLAIPVGIISGKQDQITHPSVAGKLVQNLKNLKGQFSDEKSGHMLVWEAPGKIVEMVRALVYQREFMI